MNFSQEAPAILVSFGTSQLKLTPTFHFKLTLELNQGAEVFKDLLEGIGLKMLGSTLWGMTKRMVMTDAGAGVVETGELGVTGRVGAVSRGAGIAITGSGLGAGLYEGTRAGGNTFLGYAGTGIAVGGFALGLNRGAQGYIQQGTLVTGGSSIVGVALMGLSAGPAFAVVAGTLALYDLFMTGYEISQKLQSLNLTLGQIRDALDGQSFPLRLSGGKVSCQVGER